MRRAARQLPQIVADGADIRPAPAANRHANAVVGRFLVQFDGFHMHDAHRGFDILAIAGAFVEGLAVLLDGAEDTGALLNIADKVLRSFLHGGKIRIILPCRGDFARRVLRIRRRTERTLRHIRFFLIHQIVEQPRRPPNHDGQHARRFGVKRPGVTDALFARHAADIPYDGGAGHSRRFEDIQKAIHASGSSSLAAASG